MTPVSSTTQVFEAIQRVKAGAPAFCTNFFPVQKRLESWIEHGELSLADNASAAFLFRKDRDFWHFYFCAASADVLSRECANSPELTSQPLSADLVGDERAVGQLRQALETAGFRRYRRLQRMARVAKPLESADSAAETHVVNAEARDRDSVLQLLNAAFDRFADQLPAGYEIEAALVSRQILAVKADGELGAILFFETQGFTSTLRYWAVDTRFRSRRLGSALMRHYFAMHGAVRRFVLWVVSENQNAVQKYEHYGYAADGLTDQVLVNAKIAA